MPRLVFIHPQHAGQRYQFATEKTTVGRSNTNVLVIQDAAVSRVHCEILVWGNEVIVRDLGSRNGTLLDGRLLHDQQAPMHAGQIVQIGSVKARLELDLSVISDPGDSVSDVHEYVRLLENIAEGFATTRRLPTQMVIAGGAQIGFEEPSETVEVVLEKSGVVNQPNVSGNQSEKYRGLRRVFYKCARLWRKRARAGNSER